MKSQNIPLFRKGQGPKNAHLGFNSPQGQSQIHLDGVQGTSNQPIPLESKNAKTVFMGIDRMQAIFRVFKDVVISAIGFKVGTKLGHFGKNGNDSFEFRITYADVKFRATALGNLGAPGAFVIDGTDGFVVNADWASTFHRRHLIVFADPGF
jgi:propanediol dehydratase large subunit